MKKMAVYILKCSDDSLYVGVTNNIERRIKEHHEGLNPKSYTAQRRPLQLMWVGYYNSPMEAIRKEKQIKRWGKQKKEALINGDFDGLHELAMCINESSHLNYTPGLGYARPDGE
jgi:putative endonuclease